MFAAIEQVLTTDLESAATFVHEPNHAAATTAARAQHRTRELVGWLLKSAYSHADIAKLVGISIKGVEYHAACARKEALHRTSASAG